MRTGGERGGGEREGGRGDERVGDTCMVTARGIYIISQTQGGHLF